MTPLKSLDQNGQGSITINFSDSTDCAAEEIHWCDRGVTLRTKWYFREGAEVELGVTVGRRRHACSGVVVACDRLREPGNYLMTLFFVEPPCREIQRATKFLQGELATL